MLIDTGPLVALLDADDRYHVPCREAFRRLRRPPLTVWPVLTEASHLLGHLPGAAQRLLGLVTSEAVRLAALDERDVPRIAEILFRYRDLPADLADASLVRVAEREGETTVLTVDRDFDVYRIDGKRALNRVPRLR